MLFTAKRLKIWSKNNLIKYRNKSQKTNILADMKTPFHTSTAYDGVPTR